MIAAKSTRVASKKGSLSQRGSEIRENIAGGWQETQNGNQLGTWSGVNPESDSKILLHIDIPVRTIQK